MMRRLLVCMLTLVLAQVVCSQGLADDEGRTSGAPLSVSSATPSFVFDRLADLSGPVARAFPDVSTDHPHYSAVQDLVAAGIIDGYESGDFGPDDPANRQQFAKMIVGAAGYTASESDVCPFADVVESDATMLYPDNFIAVIAAHGITKGTTATTFDPYGEITRYQVVSMVVRAADDLRPGLLATPPTDWLTVGDWGPDPTHGPNVRRAHYNGLLVGLNLAALSPTGSMSRSEVAQVLHNLLGILAVGSTTLPAPESPLEIVSIDCNPPGDDNANLNEEYITFRVLVSGPLLGYVVEDESGSHYGFPDGTFSAGQIFRLHTGSGTDSQTDLYWGSTTAVWDNGSDAVTVLDPLGRVVISHLYYSPTTDD